MTHGKKKNEKRKTLQRGKSKGFVAEAEGHPKHKEKTLGPTHMGTNMYGYYLRAEQTCV